MSPDEHNERLLVAIRSACCGHDGLTAFAHTGIGEHFLGRFGCYTIIGEGGPSLRTR